MSPTIIDNDLIIKIYDGLNQSSNSKSLIKWLLYGNVLLEDPLSYYIIIFKYLPKYVVGTYNTLWVCSIYLKVLPPM